MMLTDLAVRVSLAVLGCVVLAFEIHTPRPAPPRLEASGGGAFEFGFTGADEAGTHPTGDPER